jgi:hypothetical protein
MLIVLIRFRERRLKSDNHTLNRQCLSLTIDNASIRTQSESGVRLWWTEITVYLKRDRFYLK